MLAFFLSSKFGQFIYHTLLHVAVDTSNKTSSTPSKDYMQFPELQRLLTSEGSGQRTIKDRNIPQLKPTKLKGVVRGVRDCHFGMPMLRFSSTFCPNIPVLWPSPHLGAAV